MQNGGLLVRDGFQNGGLLDRGASTAPVFSTSTLPDGDVGSAYSFQILITGSPTITCSITAGSTGWATVSSSGLITGNPTPGNLSFTVQAANGAGTVTRAFTLTTPNEAGGTAEIPVTLYQMSMTTPIDSLITTAAAMVFATMVANAPMDPIDQVVAIQQDFGISVQINQIPDIITDIQVQTFVTGMPLKAIDDLATAISASIVASMQSAGDIAPLTQSITVLNPQAPAWSPARANLEYIPPATVFERPADSVVFVAPVVLNGGGGMRVGAIEKQPWEEFDVDVDFSKALAAFTGGDGIAVPTVSVSGGGAGGAMTYDTVSHNGGKVKAWIRGGTSGRRYTLTYRVQTNGGRRLEAEVSVKVKETT